MGKRSVLASDSAPKRGKHAAASSPQDVPRSASDQQARRQAAGAATGERAPAAAAAAAAAAAPSSEQVLAEFDPVKWAQAESMPESLQQQFKQRLGEALKPSEDGCWSFVGPPMPKDAVLTHYRCDAPSGDNKRDGRRWPGVFHLDSKDLTSLETAQDEVPLFHFEGLLMHDKDAGERWEVTLGDCVIIPERKKQGSSTVVEEMVGRVTDIFVTVKGERYVRVHWMYRAVDTPLAAGPKESNGTKKEQGEQHVAQLPIGDCLVHPRMLRVCGSDEDNQRYNTHYKLAEIDRKTRVVHIKPGYKHPTEDPSFEGEFDDQQDWFYNSYTHTDHFMFADCFEDYTLFGPHYKQLWQAKGVAGIRALLPRLKIPASLMRGLSGKKLVLVQLGEGKRVLYVLELFCGGGGLAYLAQFNGKVAIKHGWANDINNSASATYTCNHPEAFMSCVGLEELTQLCMKWGLEVVRYCGSGWMQIPELQQLRSGGPQRKFARTHIPQGVGVWGTTMGKAGTSSDGHTAAAARGEKAVREYRAQQGLPPPVFGAAEDEQQQQQQPDFEVICKRLPKISPADSSDAPSVGDFMPRLTELEEEEDGGAAAAAAGSSAAAARAKAKKDKEKQRMQEAYEQARQQQQQCIDECVAFNKQHGRGKVLEVRDVRIKDCAVRVKQGSSRNQIEEGLTDWECWLEYEVRRERTGASSSSSSSDDSSEWAWEHQALLWRPDGVAPMQRFMLAMLADKQIPMPGDVGVLTGGPPCQRFRLAMLADKQISMPGDVGVLTGGLPCQRFMLAMLADKQIPMPGNVGELTGGPPCQNVSGLNRHAKQQEILNDPKNRLVTAYMKLIGYLQPSFIFMEQVCDVWRKENATYARYAMTLMVGSGYQAHAAICVAGEYGVPQGRMRAMFWGAASGKEQLPPFPAPTHRCLPFNQDFPLSGAACRAEFPKGEAGLHPWTLMGDVLTDLPAVSNYEEGDRQHYASDPQSVAQAWLRRTPPGYSRSLPERCIYAGAAMEPWQQMQQRAPEMLAQSESEDKLAMTLAVGARLLCKGKGSISLADLTGPSAAAAAAGPSDGAGSSSAAAAAGAKQQGKQPSAGKKGAGKKGAAAAADEVAASDEGGDAADDEDTAELAAEMQGGSHFATQTWLKHLNSIEDPIARQILHLQRAAELHNTQYVRGQQKLHMDAAAAQVDAAAPLRDHRPLMCNEDDYRRMCAVPKEKGANFRDMPGVVTHPGAAGSKSGRGTCCSGSWHAEQRTVDSAANKALLAANLAAWRALSEEERGKKDDMAFLFRGVEMEANAKDGMAFLFRGVEMECGCPGGGMPPKPPKGFQGSDGNHKSFRVDSYGSTANGAWRGSKLEGCSSVTYFTNTGDLVCPRWCVTYKGGASNGRHGCFGRMWWDQIQPTVVTRAEPHNLELVHPTQDRVLSIRENARCQVRRQ
ncbi:hypothetical protein OEZ85_004945 [Tetradesmus obliquus]|uniref:DNA (cytosine-5-)-methyltransferase n=1 Tax=Tetradesmus obliquus TaxID=3088 RepID=A0ABY8UHP4_TETOB|nr:hypothetical protein OEZ85_004945 [Tetradesmus obliquus]